MEFNLHTRKDHRKSEYGIQIKHLDVYTKFDEEGDLKCHQLVIDANFQVGSKSVIILNI